MRVQRKRHTLAPLSFVWGIALLVALEAASADEALVAVATNFSEVAEQLRRDFERASTHRLTLVSGSSGKLYAQIIQGAPFAVLLSADQQRPEQLVRQGMAREGSQFTYAVGRLVLWSADADLLAENPVSVLRSARFRKLAVANPELAPYGRAAIQALQTLGLHQGLQRKLVVGENIGQTHAMVATGNAELGFVALSYLNSPHNQINGSRWVVPRRYHTPVRQDAVLLDVENGAAHDFVEYLRGDDARRIIEGYGYFSADLPAPPTDSE